MARLDRKSKSARARPPALSTTRHPALVWLLADKTNPVCVVWCSFFCGPSTRCPQNKDSGFFRPGLNEACVTLVLACVFSRLVMFSHCKADTWHKSLRASLSPTHWMHIIRIAQCVSGHQPFRIYLSEGRSSHHRARQRVYFVSLSCSPTTENAHYSIYYICMMSIHFLSSLDNATINSRLAWESYYSMRRGYVTNHIAFCYCRLKIFHRIKRDGTQKIYNTIYYIDIIYVIFNYILQLNR